jgi:Arc/MetJ-type ribon-helix-helix transcriptional regulator
MNPNFNQKLSISLPPELIKFSEDYQHTHQLSSRSEVFAKALQALRDFEFMESYRQAALDATTQTDILEQLDAIDGLEASDGSKWL